MFNNCQFHSILLTKKVNGYGSKKKKDNGCYGYYIIKITTYQRGLYVSLRLTKYNSNIILLMYFKKLLVLHYYLLLYF